MTSLFNSGKNIVKSGTVLFFSKIKSSTRKSMNKKEAAIDALNSIFCEKDVIRGPNCIICTLKSSIKMVKNTIHFDRD